MDKKILVHSRIIRICHWLFAFSVILLITSGLYSHYPVKFGNFYDMKTNVFIQIAVAFFATGVFTVWVYYNLMTEAYKDLWFKPRDIIDFKGLLKYYLFIEKNPPYYGKYNAGQRIIFSSWVLVFIFMALTGIILYMVNFGYILPFAVMLQKLRFYHFLGALWFVGTVPLHIYLVITEDPAKLQAIFTGWIKK